MPRKAPSSCGEVRLTLGNYEREQLTQIVNAKETQLYLQPFVYVLPVATIGAVGYFGLAYMFEWWPFEPKKSALGFGYVDRFMVSTFEDEEKREAIFAKNIQEFDDKVVYAQQWLVDNPSPNSAFGKLQHSALSRVVSNAPEQRTEMLETQEKVRVQFAKQAAAIRAKSDYV